MVSYFKFSIFKISLLMTAISVFIGLSLEFTADRFPFLKSIELKTYDAKFRWRGTRPIQKNIVIVAIDDKSIEMFGRWPWNRAILAEGLERILDGKPKLVAFDMVFSEKDPTSADSDPIFSGVIQKSEAPVLLGYFFYFLKRDIAALNTDWEKQFEAVFDSKITAKISTVPYPPEEIPTGLGIKSSIEPYAKATRNHGFFDISSDVDGVIRKTHLIGKHKNTLFPSFGLKTASLIENKDIVVQFGNEGIEKIRLGGDELPTNERGELWINFSGPAQTFFPQTFQTHSFADLYHRAIDTRQFRDKIVIFGVTAKAVSDLRTTPTSASMPGVELNATIAENILNRNFLIRPNQAFALEIALIILFGILFYPLLLSKLNSIASALAFFILLAACHAIDQKFLFEKGLVANSFLVSSHLFFVFLTSTIYKYFVQEKKTRQTRAAFQHYVSPAVVNEILKHPDQLALGGEKRRLTVLFSDIRNFTSISEKTEPAKLTQLLNTYLTEMTNIVYEHQGMLDKYVGDELMALYGAPLKTPTHAQDACLSAIEMIQKLPKVKEVWAKEGISELNIGIGIHTGEMIVGNMGSTKIFDYTVIGDSVNLGSRLEGTNKIYGTCIIISQEVYNEVAGRIFCRELDFIRVRGKKEPVRIYEVFTEKPDNSFAQMLNHYVRGLTLYRNQKWQDAANTFEQILKIFPNDGPSRALLERCRLSLQSPPPKEWDGVFTMTVK